MCFLVRDWSLYNYKEGRGRGYMRERGKSTFTPTEKSEGRCRKDLRHAELVGGGGQKGFR